MHDGYGLAPVFAREAAAGQESRFGGLVSMAAKACRMFNCRRDRQPAYWLAWVVGVELARK